MDSAASPRGRLRIVAWTKTIICFANSRKYLGRCIAGKEWVANEPGDWIRPVSDRPMGELSARERRSWWGREPRLLDVIRVTIEQSSPEPHAFQRENYMIAPRSRFRRKGRCKWKNLGPWLDAPPALWRNGNSSYYGSNDRVSLSVASTFSNSLFLIEPRNLRVEVVEEGEEFGESRRRLRAHFTYKGVPHCLSVTDPVAERAFRHHALGKYPINDAYLCVSLGEPHVDHFCYKLVAGIIAKRPY